MEQAKKKLLIVAPYQDEEAFLDTMVSRLGADIALLNYRTNLAVSRGVWRRHVVILKMAFKAFLAARGQDLVLFGEQFVGLYYALFCRLFFWQRPAARSMVLQLIYNGKPGWKGALYQAAYGWLIGSECLDHLVCHASLEREYYQRVFGPAVGRKIHFVAFGRDKPDESRLAETADRPRFFFAGGTSNRDYRTLIEAFRGLPSQLVVACHANDIKGVDVPENVTVHHDMFGVAFQQCLNAAYAVILPILHTDVSAGQLVLIDAMRAGKATVVTGGSCMEDYVDKSCALTVPRQDVAAMREAVRALEQDEGHCTALGREARARYAALFTRNGFAERLCDIFLAHNLGFEDKKVHQVARNEKLT